MLSPRRATKRRKPAPALIDQIRHLRPCQDAADWLGSKTLATAWRTCKRPDWLLWLCGRIGIDRVPLVLAACDCAELVLVRVPNGEDRPRACIETTRRWCRGEATIEEVREARRAAAATAVYAYAAAYAAADAADAADAAAAAAAAAATAREQTRAKCRRLIRARIPLSAIKAALGNEARHA